MQTIFSTYTQGENRVTSTIIQVLKNLPVNIVDRFLMMFTSSDTQTFVNFRNQVDGGNSVPDAEISANFRVLFETKIIPNSINETQLKNHVKMLEGTNDTLVYLTPDDVIPQVLKAHNETFSDKNIKWKSFEQISNLISELVDDEALILSERDQFLLRNLQEFFEESGLLPIIDEVVIVAASTAWPVYQKHGLYVCQPQRAFRSTKWLGFYANGYIQPKIAKIISNHDNYEHGSGNLEESSIPRDKLSNWLDDNQDAKGLKSQIFDLSCPGSDDTVTLNSEIPNDLKNSRGRGYAFTQGQRYTTLEKLRIAKVTTDLL